MLNTGQRRPHLSISMEANHGARGKQNGVAAGIGQAGGKMPSRGIEQRGGRITGGASYRQKIDRLSIKAIGGGRGGRNNERRKMKE